MSVVYGKQTSFSQRPRTLKHYRRVYPFRLVRDTDREPKPGRLPREEYGEFARFPAPSGDEWLFLEEKGRDLFLERFGGIALPVLEILPDGTIKAPKVKNSAKLSGATVAAISRHLQHISLPFVDITRLDRTSRLLDARLEARKKELRHA